jgi:hypothetical protein
VTRALVLVVTAALVVVAVAATRAVWEGRGALADGDAALVRGDRAEAIASWRRAARWYVPAVGATGDAFDRLERLAGAAEAEADTAAALAAWQAVRGAAVAIRGATAPFDDHRRAADVRIAALLAAQPTAATAAGATALARTAWHARILDGAVRPTRGWLVLAALGLAAMIVGGALAASAATRTRHASLILALGAAAWLAGVTLA